MRVGAGLRWQGATVAGALTLFALLVHGYHPYSEDGGIYVAGIKRLIDPTLYGPHPDFVTEHLRFSVFAPMVAGLVRASHIPLEWMLLSLYLASVYATLYAAWMIAARCTENIEGRGGAVTLLACWLTLPIAGTSLMLVDPYLTARSLTTPLVLAALAWTMDAMRGNQRAIVLAGVALLAAAAMHPLMAAYGLAAALVLAAMHSNKRWWAVAVLGGMAVLAAGAMQAMAPAESAGYTRVVATRYYWFISEWQWYEKLGLVAPLLILAWFSGKSRLANGALALGLIAAAVNLGFAHLGYATHLVAELQPLRSFQLVYIFMIVLLGIWVGENLLGSRAWRWAAMMLVLGGVMFGVQSTTYPGSAHIEWPGVQSRNLWQQAFVWVRENTPKDALFAMDPHYIQADGEDAQCFRAFAERDALPDYSKDGGEASITPSLTEQWMQGQSAQLNIEDENDIARIWALKPLGVEWVVLRAGSATEWSCPYRNELVKVCKLPR